MTIPPFAVFTLCVAVALAVIVVLMFNDNRPPPDDDEEGLA
jgi:hypothetical protein